MALGATLAIGGGCQQPELNTLDKVVELGEVVVVTRPGATTYYLGPDGETGLEFDLAQGFAEFLGVGVRIITAHSIDEMFDAVTQGHAHFAAGGVAITEARRQRARFGPPYQDVTQQVVYRFGSDRPTGLEALNGGRFQIASASAHAERVASMQNDYPDLAWEYADGPAEELLARVWTREADYTVAHSHLVAVQQRYFPELRVAFDLEGTQSLAWAFPHSKDASLYQAAERYFAEIKENGQLARLLEKHYGHLREFDYVGTRVFMRHIEERLPHYRAWFEEAAEANGLDWRLLAAMAYQESHWNPRAVSPTGVRGIMMLTQATARDLGLDQRTDPQQSIDGGARYFRHLWDRMPSEIPEPDRMWMAVAAYNIGAGHVAGVRHITTLRGGNPNSWADVKENLPLLQQREWYQQTRNGYARGNEAFVYVENIRSYYDILLWTMDREPHLVRGPRPQVVAAQ
ncbi:membrane-bound lytic murein transglycosylase MltF [Ectothiorhodospiraceae bacterium 2226]|nr:membrane-bound lytic murein transglycosylase MltF [Ectothiorhodospiraceae bacterium 2226]